MSKRLIKQLIGRGFLGEAIELMLELVEKYGEGSSVENTLYNISGQYYSNESAKKSSTITTEIYNTAKNRLNGNLSEILDDNFREIDENDIPDKYKNLLKTSPKTNDEDNGGGNAQSSNIVLFLSANPSQTALLKLKDEHSNIARELQESTLRVNSEEAVSFAEFSMAIYSRKPRIVHFSGHGDLKSPEVQEAFRVRGIGKPKGLVDAKEEKEEPGIILFDDSKRHSHFVKSSVLKELFSTAKIDLEIPLEAVVFNACHSEEQARAVSEVGITVIGTSHSVGDEAAIAFSRVFYFGLANGMDIEKSFKVARVQAM